MLTARDDELDKVLGLELGADDYITKPFSIREFRSRVKALLRRARTPWHEDAGGRGAARGGRPADRRAAPHASRCAASRVQLTYVEFELLRTLMAHPGRVYSRRMLLEALWGTADFRDPRTIDVHIRHLREKIEADSHRPEHDPHRAQRRLPLPRRMNPLRSVRGRLALALLRRRRRRARRSSTCRRPVVQELADRRAAQPASSTNLQQVVLVTRADRPHPERARMEAQDVAPSPISSSRWSSSARPRRLGRSHWSLRRRRARATSSDVQTRSA